MISDCTATKNSKSQKKIESEFAVLTSNLLVKKKYWKSEIQIYSNRYKY